ncbi:MAG: hybrid sensor histidine kinase/response regulator [Anaerolineae bacterium]
MHSNKDIRILIAEDDYLVNEMIRGMLTDLGYTVAGSAKSGNQAVAMAEQLKPSVILMDVQMPGMDGIAAAQKIQQCCPTPIVILTAYETPELVHQASDAGVNAYLIKPTGSREMERAITIALARFEDMTALSRLNNELKESNEELDAFAHTVAHDLQNPLSLVLGFAETLQVNYDFYPPEQHKEILAKIMRIANKMSNIIDELLLLASVRQVDVDPQALDMTSIIVEAQQRLADDIDQHQAEISLPEAWPAALGYAPWVEEVWFNYLSNGIKYGGQPPLLRLGASAQPGNMVRFWIRDNGKGITAVQQKNLFIPFTKLSQAHTKGYGLGLSIVRRIVERLGGEVGLESEVGEGSTFWVTLPKAE